MYMKTNIVSHKLSFKSRILFLRSQTLLDFESIRPLFPWMTDGIHLLTVNSLQSNFHS